MEHETSNNLEPANIGNVLLAPVDNPESDCFGCTAGMCDHQICRGDQYFWNVNNHEFIERENPEPKKIEMVDKNILKCHMCGWEHHNPSEWQNYKRATNGTLQKWCGNCGRISLLERTISVPFNGC